MLVDPSGRTLDYLRVSVTDRCNLRCVYCMPAEGVTWKPHDSVLRFEEILRICRVMAELGIKRIKVTGGEPLVRRGIASFIKELKLIPGIQKVTFTTNGFLLGAYLDEAEAGAASSLPDAVNISLDALNPALLKRITRTENVSVQDVLLCIDRLLEKKIPVKINCVPIGGFNEEEIIPLAALAREKNIAVRFIELMPLGIASAFRMISGRETAALLEKAFGKLTAVYGGESAGPALYYSLSGFTGKIGFISPVTCGFCDSCNRLRLTSEGRLKPCLFGELAFDLKAILRGKEQKAGDACLATAVLEAVSKKPAFNSLSHVYGKTPAEIKSRRFDGMFGIGG